LSNDSASADIKIMGISFVLSFDLSLLQVSNPSIPGINISNKIKSGKFISAFEMPDSPLVENEEKYRILFEKSNDAILLIDGNKFRDCNLSTVKMLGYKTKSEFLNTHPSKLSPEKQPDGRLSYDKAEEMMALAYEKGIHKFEWIHKRANGEDFPVEVWLTFKTFIFETHS